MVNLDPLPANEDEPVGLRQELFDLRLGEAFAFERHLHREVQQSIHPQLRWLLAADGRLHLRAGRPVHAPTRRHPHDDASAFERGNVPEEL
jgi:hypothetical protein